MNPCRSALGFRYLQLATPKPTRRSQNVEISVKPKGICRLYSVQPQPAWFKHIGGTYEALQYDSNEDALTTVSLPTLTECKEDQVLVRVAYAGVCKNDIKMLSVDEDDNLIWSRTDENQAYDYTYSNPFLPSTDNHGEIPHTKSPITPGHEISGYVNKIGEKVKKVVVGDRVTVNPIRNCGTCEYCLRMMPNYCTKLGRKDVLGYQMDGTWAEYCVVSEDQIYKLDSCLDIRYGVLCPVLSANLRAWNMVMPTSPDTRFLVLGAGIHGKIMLAMLHYQGYKNVIITDHCEMDRASVRKYTACALDYQILSPCKVADMVARGWKRDCLDIAFACTHNVNLMEQAITWLRPMGKMVIFSYVPCNKNIRLPANIFFDKEVQIMGAFLNPYTFQLAVEWAKNLGGKYLELYPLGIKVFHLKDYKKAIRAARDGSITKAVFKLDK